jgi:hypothetical protein
MRYSILECWFLRVYRDRGDRKKADDALDDMRVTAASLQATAFYYYAVDQKFRYIDRYRTKAPGDGVLFGVDRGG